MINTRSIQFRLVSWYSCLVALVLLAFGLYTYHGLDSRLYGEMEHTLNRRAQQIEKQILKESLSAEEAGKRIRSVYSPEASNRFIRILRQDGSVFYASGQPQDGSFNPGDVQRIDMPPALRFEHLPQHVDMLVTALRSDDGNYIIEMGLPTAEMEQTLNGLLTTLGYGLPVVILIVAAGGYRLVRRSLQPVEDIQRTAQEITFGNLRNRVPVAPTGDALEHLSVTLNQMLARLESAYDQASRFSADASHELRTPLAIMRSELESLAQERDMPNRLTERMGSVLEETERLSRIAQSLFTISRLDAGEARMEHKPVDIAALARSTAEQMALMAEEKGITLNVAVSEPLWLTADAARLKQVVVNLLDNAFTYTRQGGEVHLHVLGTGSKAVLEVRDNGCGISAEALPHVFKRFYQADPTRVSGRAGLGLSIVEAICAAHGATASIESAEGQGTTVRIEFPLEEAKG